MMRTPGRPAAARTRPPQRSGKPTLQPGGRSEYFPGKTGTCRLADNSQITSMPGPGTVQVAASGCAAVRSLPASVAWVNETTDRDARTRARIEQHWQASESGDADTEHAIYAADAILDYPQSGERFRSRSKIQAQRGGHPAERHFTVLRIRGGGDLWISECVITYDGAPAYSVSIMELRNGQVIHETQYFADPFPAPASRAALAEPIR